MKKIKEYFDVRKNNNAPFAFVAIAYVAVGIYLKDPVWIALAAVFLALSGTIYTKPPQK